MDLCQVRTSYYNRWNVCVVCSVYAVQGKLSFVCVCLQGKLLCVHLCVRACVRACTIVQG